MFMYMVHQYTINWPLILTILIYTIIAHRNQRYVEPYSLDLCTLVAWHLNSERSDIRILSI